MARTVTFKSNPLTLRGEALKEGQPFPEFSLTNGDLQPTSNDILSGKVSVLLTVPSLDTPVCSTETKRFNTEATEIGEKVQVVAISKDLPFAQKRWCGAEDANHVVALSDYRNEDFGTATGTFIEELGLLARAVFVVDETGNISYAEYVAEVTDEPDYEAALAKAKKLAN